MDFIGREREMEVLQYQYESVEHPFVIIKGRRRVGKSRLITEFCKDKDALYFQADKEDSESILKSFCNKLSKKIGISALGADSWETAIDMFVRLSEPVRKILVIDEFQYIVKSDKNAEKEFQAIWDTILSKADVMFIICGSYRTMMDDLTKYDRPLYGRNTCDLMMRPLEFRDCMFSSDYRRAVERYAFTGGVPHYLALFDKRRTVRDNIVSLTMDVGGALTNEVPYLMSDEFRDVKSYNTYLKTIASGNHRMDEICSALGIRSTDASPYISKLMAAGIIERRIPIMERNPEKCRTGLYFISDRFISFWYRFVYPYRDDITLGFADGAVSELDAHFKDSFVSFVFEDICKTELRRHLRSTDVMATYGSQWGNGYEFDIVAKDDKNKTVYVGECKYRNSPIGYDVLQDLRKRCDETGVFSGYKVIHCIFSVSGYTDEILKEANRDDVLLFQKGEHVTRYGELNIDNGKMITEEIR